MDLIGAMGQHLTGLREAPHADHTPAELAELLVNATGSGRAAARFLGVGESTFRGWRHGVRPRRGAAPLVAAARRASGDRFAPGAYGAAYRGDTQLSIRGVIKVSGDQRLRTVHPGPYIPRASIQAVLRAWTNGQDARAERLLLKAIDTNYQPLNFIKVLRVWFE